MNWASTAVPSQAKIGIMTANSALLSEGGAVASAAVTTALKPTFYPVDPQGRSSFALSSLMVRQATGVSSSTVGAAVYSIVYSAAATYTATLVCQLNAALDTSGSNGYKTGDVTPGAAASGASVVTLDFTNNFYVVGAMASTVTTLTLGTVGYAAAYATRGILSWTDTARSSTTDWPSSFTNSNAPALGGSTKLVVVDLVEAAGKLFT